VLFFDPRVGRPSTPMQTYLRIMFLKFRYRLGYESLRSGVGDSITWRRICRIPIDGKVPHPTTLMKLTTRCGTAAVQGCNEALLAKAIRRSRSPAGGSRTRVARPAPGCGTAAGRRVSGHTESREAPAALSAGRDEAQATV